MQLLACLGRLANDNYINRIALNTIKNLLKNYYKINICNDSISRMLGWAVRHKYITTNIVIDRRDNNTIKAKYLNIKLLNGYYGWLSYYKKLLNEINKGFDESKPLNNLFANEFTSTSHDFTPNRQEHDRQNLNTEEKSSDNKEEKSCNGIVTTLNTQENIRQNVEALNNKIRVRNFIGRFSSGYTDGYSTNEEYLRSVVDNYLNPPDKKWIYFYIKKYRENWIPFFNIFISPLEPIENKYSDKVIQRIANHLHITQPLKEREVDLVPYRDSDFNTIVCKGVTIH